MKTCSKLETEMSRPTKIFSGIVAGFMILLGAQAADAAEESNGNIFGVAFGVSIIKISTASTPSDTQSGFSFPNIKVGKMIGEHTALLVYLPGTIYKYSGSGRNRARGAEGIVPSVQYWLSDRAWVLGGAGLGLDSPVFYDTKGSSESKFYYGTAAVMVAGYDLWKQDKFTVDVQGRAYLANINLPEGSSKRSALNLLIGINW